MATPVLLPKQGQSVESCLIVEWKKAPGETVAVGEVLCEIETDKAVMEIESPAEGTLLATFFEAGDVAPVQVNIAAIGAPGEDASGLRPAEASPAASAPSTAQAEMTSPARSEDAPQTEAQRASPPSVLTSSSASSPAGPSVASPRARRLADRHGIDLSQLTGTGPGGRIIERDIPLSGPLSEPEAPTSAAMQTEASPHLSPVAKAMVEEGSYRAPSQGSGPRGRVMTRDLQPVAPASDPTQAGAHSRPAAQDAAQEIQEEPITAHPLQGVRKRIAQRMRESLHNSAQLTLNRTADARALQKLRALFKAADPATGLQQVSINDLILYTVAQTLLDFPALNARFEEETLYEYGTVHLGFAVDTPRGLLVPVVRHAQAQTLRTLTHATQRLGTACREGTIGPDELGGGTFTVTNLGSLGIESFTPILNPPQVAILGIGAIELKPIAGENSSAQQGNGIEFIPHLHLSLTIDHQVVDGAPGAHFLQAFANRLATLDRELIFAGAIG